MKINENQKRYNKKIKQIKTLTKKALKNKFKYKPCKGFTFLKDVKKGNLIKINGFLAIILKSNDVSCNVLVTSGPSTDSYYLGVHRWAPQTEVKIIK